MKAIHTSVIVSFILAGIAFLVPWVTHFADQGLSVLAHLAWVGVAVIALVRHGRRALLVLLGAPFALFWPIVLVWVIASDGLRLSF
jgi:hypothetical protein